MGYTNIDVAFTNPQNPKQTANIIGLVDTGANLSVIPKKLAEALGVKIQGYQMVKTLNKVRKMGYTDVKIKIEGREGIFRTLISSREDDRIIIGVVPMEVLGFEIDPINRKLKKVKIYA